MLPRSSLLLLVSIAVACAPISREGTASRGAMVKRPAATSDRAFPDLPELDQEIESVLSSSGVPGANVAIVKLGKVAFAKGYGKARLSPGAPMQVDTLVNVASISKTITATAAMKLVEEGKLDLDADVSTVLGFSIRNPRFESVPITLRMLLTHTSSIDISDKMGEALDQNFGDGTDSKLSLETLVTDSFTPGKRWYTEENFKNVEPGTTWDYCNICPAITAVLVEKASNKPFDAFCKSAIFDPLGMSSTSWRIAGIDPERLAVGYTGDGTKAVSPAGHVYYPSTTLRMPAIDLARFILEFTNEHKVLDASTFNLMKESQSPRFVTRPSAGPAFGRPPLRGSSASAEVDMRIGFMGDPEDGESVLGHNGSDEGHSANYAFDTMSGVGVVVLLNGDGGQDSGEPPYRRIQNALWQAAEGL